MKIKLTESRQIEVALISALAGRKINIQNNNGDAYLPPALARKWSEFTEQLEAHISALGMVFSSGESEGEYAIKTFRQLTYIATELFDTYQQLFVNAVGKFPKPYNENIKAFSRTAKKRRDRWAELCNTFKHNNVSTFFVSAARPYYPIETARYLCVIPNKQSEAKPVQRIHKAQASNCLVQDTLSMIHDLLKVDAAAAALVHILPDNQQDAIQAASIQVDLAPAMNFLSKHPPLKLNHQKSGVYDNVVLQGDYISLERANATPQPRGLNASMRAKGDGFTKTFPLPI